LQRDIKCDHSGVALCVAPRPSVCLSDFHETQNYRNFYFSGDMIVVLGPKVKTQKLGSLGTKM